MSGWLMEGLELCNLVQVKNIEHPIRISTMNREKTHS